ncbi:MAG: hypothetical protein QXR17_06420 [Candidatus Bathyarchaeia archaeon]
MRLRLNVDEPFSLDLTMMPSFVSSMYVGCYGGTWVKVVGVLGGLLELRQEKPNVLMVKCGLEDADFVAEIVKLEVGLWHKPFEDFINGLPFRDVLIRLAEAYPGVRVPIAPHDFSCILIAVALSRRTSYERFVLEWCRRLWRLYGCNLEAISKLSLDEFRAVGSSYQVLQLKEILSSFRGIEVSDLFRLNPYVVRRRLLSTVKFFGPKAVDSLILSTFKASDFMPCDTHLYTVASRLGLVNAEDTLMPQKELCIKYACTVAISNAIGAPLCPRRGKCLRAKLSWLREVGGWLQTIAYIHGSKICRERKPLCSRCSVRGICQYLKA